MRFDFFRRSEVGKEPDTASAASAEGGVATVEAVPAEADEAQGHIVHAMLLDNRKRAVGYRLAWRPVGGGVEANLFDAQHALGQGR